MRNPARWSPAALIVAALLLPGSALGAGYGIYEQGARALGMAGAAAASVGDASALFFNPAALTRLEGTQLYVGGSALTTNTSFAGVAPYPGYGVTEEMKPQTFALPAVYVSHAIAPRWVIGAGFYAPYGLGVEWKNPDTFTGRYILTKADLTGLNGGLSVAYAIDPRWSVAVGGNVMFSKVELHRRQFVPIPGGGGAEAEVAKLDLVSDWSPGYGWNAAVSFVPDARWKLGASYRGKVVVDTDGSADFTQILTGDPTLDANVAASLPPDQGVSTVLRFPAIWSAGASYDPVRAWTLEADLVVTEWSLFRDLPLRFSQTPSVNATLREDYANALAVRTGAEHRLDGWSYRFGYYYEQEAAPSASVTPLLPDAARHGVTVGATIPLGAGNRITLDLYDLALFVPKRSTDGVERDGYDGTYRTFINSFGLNLNWRL